MISIMAGEVMLQALVLCGILRLVARHEADTSFAKVAMVTAGITLGTFCIEVFVSPHIGRFSLLVSVAFITFMLMTFCWISLAKSLAVVLIFSAFHVVLFFAAHAIQARIMASVGKTQTQLDRHTGELDAIRQEMERQAAMQYGNTPPSADTDADVIAGLDDVIDAELAAAPLPEAAETPQETAPPPPPPAPAAAETPSTPTPTAPPDGNWKEARARVRVGGTIATANGKYTAQVNGTIVEPGDVVLARHDGRTYRWTVKAITRSKVDLEPLDIQPPR